MAVSASLQLPFKATWKENNIGHPTANKIQCILLSILKFMCDFWVLQMPALYM